LLLEPDEVFGRDSRLVNNLIRGTAEAPEESKGEGNILGAMEGWFTHPEVGDLHLTDKASQAIGHPAEGGTGGLRRPEAQGRP
jgi:hypothetical protein